MPPISALAMNDYIQAFIIYAEGEAKSAKKQRDYWTFCYRMTRNLMTLPVTSRWKEDASRRLKIMSQKAFRANMNLQILERKILRAQRDLMNLMNSDSSDDDEDGGISL